MKNQESKILIPTTEELILKLDWLNSTIRKKEVDLPGKHWKIRRCQWNFNLILIFELKRDSNPETPKERAESVGRRVKEMLQAFKVGIESDEKLKKFYDEIKEFVEHRGLRIPLTPRNPPVQI